MVLKKRKRRRRNSWLTTGRVTGMTPGKCDQYSADEKQCALSSSNDSYTLSSKTRQCRECSRLLFFFLLLLQLPRSRNSYPDPDFVSLIISCQKLKLRFLQKTCWTRLEKLSLTRPIKKEEEKRSLQWSE